jgi:hypothetical protein
MNAIDETSPVTAEQPEENCSRSEPPPVARFQYSLGLLVLLQTALCAGLALWRIVFGGELVMILLLLGCLSIVITGTIRIATDLDRARQVWRPVGRVLALAIGIYVLAQILGAALLGLLR